MHSRKSFWLLLLMMLWLPIQGYATVAMPFCQHAQSQSDAPPCHGDDANSAPATMCDECSFCQLCNSAVLLASLVQIDSVKAGGILIHRDNPIVSPFPPQLFKPPRSHPA